MTDFLDITKAFSIEGEFLDAGPYGSGHINDTYAVVFKTCPEKTSRYIFQRINHYVFKDPVKLMKNISSVTLHLRRKIFEYGGNPERETLNLIPTISGENLYKSPKGDYWRVYMFIEGARTYDIVENIKHFRSAGKAIGRFQELLSDFPVGSLFETIPDFHNTVKRYGNFIEAVEKDICNRAAEVKKEIEFAAKREADTMPVVKMLGSGDLPLRVTHNDTKFNNVMIDDVSGEGICLIDLDTVMPGSVLYDFGDSIRTGANPAAEDERDLSEVRMELSLYREFTEGYLESAYKFLMPTELEYLPFSAKLLTFETGLRFLTDYLKGDVYFKCHRQGHNLDRARTQFKLVEDMENKWDEMHKVIQCFYAAS